MSEENQMGLQYAARIGTGEMLGPQRQTVLSLPEESRDEIKLGVIWGEARGLSYRNNIHDVESGPAVALVGVFEFRPATPGRPCIRAATCYLPRTVHDIVVAAVRGDQPGVTEMPKRGKRIDQIGTKVLIEFEIRVKRRTAGGGGVPYEFITIETRRLTQSDPLLAVRQELDAVPMLNSPVVALIEGTVAGEDVDEETGEVAESRAVKKSGKRR